MKSNKESITLFTLATLLTVFLAGMATASYKSFPYALFQPLLAGIDLAVGTVLFDETDLEIRWKIPLRDITGVTVNDGAPRLTLIGTAVGDSVLLVDETGKTRHSWGKKYSEIWPDQKHLMTLRALDDRYFYYRDARLLDDGGIVTVMNTVGITPWGAGMLRFDRDSNVLWKNDLPFYNNFTIGYDGRLYGLYHQVNKTGIKNLESLPPPLLEDTIGIVDIRTGELRDSISIPAAFARSPFAAMLTHVGQDGSGDYLHSNAVDVIARRIPGVPWAQPGRIIVSLRNPGIMAIIDPASKTVVHAAFLPTRRQHCLHLDSKDNLLAFDNHGGGAVSGGGFTRLVALAPDSLALRWKYDGSAETPLASDEWGCIQELGDGGFMAVDGENGRVFDIDAQGIVLWEYTTPIRQGNHVPVLTFARRISGINTTFLEKP